MIVAEQGAHAVVVVLLGVGLAAIGHWGRGNAPVLVPAHLGVEERERRTRALRRGAGACYAGALVLVAVGLIAVL